MYVMNMKKEVCGSKRLLKGPIKGAVQMKSSKSLYWKLSAYFFFSFYLVFQLFFICDLVRAGNQFKRISDRHYLFCKRRICPVHAASLRFYL